MYYIFIISISISIIFNIHFSEIMIRVLVIINSTLPIPELLYISGLNESRNMHQLYKRHQIISFF